MWLAEGLLCFLTQCFSTIQLPCTGRAYFHDSQIHVLELFEQTAEAGHFLQVDYVESNGEARCDDARHFFPFCILIDTPENSTS